MIRAGVSLPAVMKMLGHQKPDMTMLYLQVSLLDLQREFRLAQRPSPPFAPCFKSP
jgi:hypothetical protein